jgi:DNA-binding NarL/FixJ family response regulator
MQHNRRAFSGSWDLTSENRVRRASAAGKSTLVPAGLVLSLRRRRDAVKESVDALLARIQKLRQIIGKSFDEIEQLQGRVTGLVGKKLYADCPLTPRQRQVMALLADRLADKEIADKLSITTRGAKFHVSNLLRRYKKETRKELGDIARAGGAGRNE